MKALSCAVLLTIALAASAQSPAPDIRATGEYAATSGDTPDTARQMALVAAERKALEEAAAKFGSLPEVNALQLNAAQVDAYAIGGLDPGSYKVFAVQGVRNDNEFDLLDFVARHESDGASVTIREGETASAQVNLVRP